MGFCPVTGEATPRHILEISQAANEALRGETYTIGTVEVAEGVDSVIVRDARCGAGKLASLVPLDAKASAVSWWLSSMLNGEMTFTFSSAPGSCRFGWALLGAGGQIKQG